MRGISKRQTLLLMIAMGLITALLGGCEKKQAATVGQVVARVGSVDVTKAELDYELRLASVQDPQSEAAKRIVKELVSRKYIAWKAAEGKLDRQPAFLLGMIRAHDQLLEGAYTQRDLSVRIAAINTSDIDRYVNTHPDKFGKRVILNVAQVVIPTTGVDPSVTNGAKSATSLDAVADYFGQRKIPFSRSNGMIDSSEVPEEFFSAIKSRMDDHVLFVQLNGSALFFNVQSSTLKPLAGLAALSLARKELIANFRKEEADKGVAEAEAQVHYEGGLSKLMGETQSAAAEPQSSLVKQ